MTATPKMPRYQYYYVVYSVQDANGTTGFGSAPIKERGDLLIGKTRRELERHIDGNYNTNNVSVLIMSWQEITKEQYNDIMSRQEG